MARASYIYVLGLGWGAEDMQTFTVKHEAQNWLQRAIADGSVDPSDIEIVTMRDGGGFVRSWTAESFLPQ
nr:hypothetical protein [uncultured Sphingomonas sp.]